jgi:RNA polymerase primary sigma factor
VLETIVERAKDRTVVALAMKLRTAFERGGSAEVVDLGALADALDRIGDEHAASDAIVALAARLDARWHGDSVRARTAYLAARNRFVGANLRLVVALAHRYGVYLMPLLDRIQEGNIGLMKAIDRFDPERGVRFSTYACWWIRCSIIRALSNDGRTVRVPPPIQALYAKAERARARLSNELGRQPDMDELARAIGCTAERLERATCTMQCRSVGFDTPPGGESGVSDTLSDETSLAALEDIVDARDRVRAIAALRDLPAREQDILHARYEFSDAAPLTLDEVGHLHGISRERARQLQVAALVQLRRKLEPLNRLQPFRWSDASHTGARDADPTSSSRA